MYGRLDALWRKFWIAEERHDLIALIGLGGQIRAIYTQLGRQAGS